MVPRMKALHDWFFKNKRDFPWREDPTPYKVWISEVMLQQTRASVVIPYFERWMGLFPDVKTLAATSLAQVIKAWEGLGYYTRARNLHQGALQIVERFGGQIPNTREELSSIRGLGPYTVGAILSFGFNQRAVAIDGNVTRVLSRYFAIEERVDKQAVKKKLVEKAEGLLDLQKPWVTAEALIELGASVCTPKPRCEECPLNEGCLALKQNKVEALPIKKSEPETIVLRRLVVVIEAAGAILLKQGEEGRVMAGLYELPYFEMGSERWGFRQAVAQVKRMLGIEGQVIGKLPEVAHTFTRYKAHLSPLHLQTSVQKQVPGYEWIPISSLATIPFSAGHRKIIAPFWRTVS